MSALGSGRRPIDPIADPDEDTLRRRIEDLAIGPRLRDLRQRPQPAQRLRALRMSDPWFGGIVVFWAVVIAATAAFQQWQVLMTITWVIGFALLFAQWPLIGTTLLFGLWTLAPLFRRLLDLVDPSSGVDLLSLTPFMATVSLAILGFRKYRPPPPVMLAFGMVVLAFLTGAVMGLAAPFAMLFGLFAYLSAVLGLFIGYANGRERLFTLEQVLLPMVLIASVYGVYQGLATRLPTWDQLWLLTTSFGSVGTKEGGNFRVFSVLNSPYTYASLVAVYLAVVFVSRRVTVLRLVTVIVALMGIFLTQSRGAWVAVLGGLVLITFFTGGRALPRLIGLAVTLVGMYAALGSTPAGTAVVQRAASVSAGANDKSGSDRITAIVTLGPPALAAPIGSGIGSVGAASDLNPNPKAALVDNGYLIMLVQVGPFAWLLLAGGIGGMVWLVVRGTTVESRRELVPLLAPVGVFVPLSFFSETLYGLPGFILFYALGEALGRRDPGTDLTPYDRAAAIDRMDRPWLPQDPQGAATAPPGGPAALREAAPAQAMAGVAGAPGEATARGATVSTGAATAARPTESGGPGEGWTGGGPGESWTAGPASYDPGLDPEPEAGPSRDDVSPAAARDATSDSPTSAPGAAPASGGPSAPRPETTWPPPPPAAPPSTGGQGWHSQPQRPADGADPTRPPEGRG